MTAVGVLGFASLAAAAIVQVAEVPTLPVTVIPAINLTAIIMGGISMGILINRVKQLERRMDKVENPWDGADRRSRPPRG